MQKVKLVLIILLISLMPIHSSGFIHLDSTNRLTNFSNKIVNVVNTFSEQKLTPLNSTSDLIKNVLAEESYSNQYFFTHYEVDNLIVIESSQMENLYRIKVNSKTLDSKTLLLDFLVEQDKVDDQIENIGLKIINNLNETNYSLIKVTNTPSNYTIALDNEPLNLIENRALVEQGEYHVSESSKNYYSKNSTLQVMKDEVIILEASLVKLEAKPFLVTSYSDNVEFDVGSGKLFYTPQLIKDTYFPIDLHYSNNLNKITVKHLGEYQQKIVLDVAKLNKEAFGFDSLDYQQKSYKSLGTSLLIASLLILNESINPMVSDKINLSPLSVALGASLTISVVDTVFHLFDYYKKTKYSF